MLAAVITLVLATTAAGPGPGDYSRSLDEKALDRAAFDAEAYGDRPSMRREAEGLRLILPQGAAESGWKTPGALRIGGDFEIVADFLAGDLPKAASEDGVAVGLAVAFQSIDQPDATLVRVVEPDGAPAYRTFEKQGGASAVRSEMVQNRMVVRNGVVMAMGNVVMMGNVVRPGQAPRAAAPRRAFPAGGDRFSLHLKREGTAIRFLVADSRSGQPRYLGQASAPPIDVVAVKLFALNRNGAGPLDVVLKGLTVRSAKISGLGTAVRTVFDRTIYGEPTAIEGGHLVIGGTAPTPAPSPAGTANAAAMLARANAAAMTAGANAARGAAPPRTPGTLPADVFAPAGPPPPKAKIPLAEVEGVRFERQAQFTARFIGQPNVDLTQGPTVSAVAAAPKLADDVAAPPPGTTLVRAPAPVEAKKNGIRDLQIALHGLRPAKIQQLMINCQTDQGMTSWQLAGGPWPLVVRRAGADPTADVFLEPPPGDCHRKTFSINLSYEDGQSASASFQAEGHSDPKLAFDEQAPASDTPDAWVFLEGDEKIAGRFEGISDDRIRLSTSWKDVMEIPLSRTAGVHISLLDRKESPESFSRRLKARGTEDVLLARSKDGEVVAIAGILERVEAGRLHFTYQGNSRSLPLKQVEGVVLAARPPETGDDFRATFALTGGARISGTWKAIEQAAWKVQAPWGQELKIPAAEIQSVGFRGGRMTYLSDLEPSRVEETPYFGRRLGWRRDAGLSGGALKVDGRTYERGVAVHSRAVLTYDLEGRYEAFEALLGFEEASRGRGRVRCRILADGRPLYDEPDLRADAPPVPLKLALGKATQLAIEVDFGADQDTGDRVVFADARLYRPAPPAGVPNASESPR